MSVISGPLADAKGRVAVQIRDLDQTVIGNPAHDLIRLGLSLASAARGSALPGVATARILEHLVAGYEAALAASPIGIRAIVPKVSKYYWSGPCAAVGVILRKNASTPRSWCIRLGRRFWALAPEERTGLRDLFDHEAPGPQGW